jgi:hypothetical protein
MRLRNLEAWKGKTARFSAFLLAVSLLAAPALDAAEAQSRSNRSTMATNAGRPSAAQTRPLPEIVARVQATPPYRSMDYIGVAGFEERQMIYILRFIDGRQVVVVHVDARSGRILGRRP